VDEPKVRGALMLEFTRSAEEKRTSSSAYIYGRTAVHLNNNFAPLTSVLE